MEVKKELERQFVVFSLQKEKYGIEISSVKEIMKWAKITELPEMRREIAGVIKLRNQVIPVVSLRTRFGLPQAEDLTKTKIIILEIGSFSLGINVDDVDEVIRIKQSAIESPNNLTVKTKVIEGVAKLDDYLLILIDIQAMFAEDDVQQILGENEEAVSSL
ncbi:MAG: chemotaxis protein CheW [Firmicutes bacterium]|nr:chemotaxis protein CheW [Bacillota bacterium]